MRKLAQLLGIIFIGIILVVLHIAISSFAEYPFNNLNIMFAGLMLVLVWRESGIVVWLCFALHFLIELYSSVPFGITLFSSTISILFAYWIHQSILTNRSWYTSWVLTSITILIYRVLYSVGIALFLTNLENNIAWSTLIYNYVWEIIITSTFTLILYIGLILVTGQVREESRFKIFQI